METAIAPNPAAERFLGLLRSHFAELRARYQVRSLGLFGSFIHGQEGLASDLDILVEFDTAPTFFRFIDLEDELSGLLGVKVDLVMKNALRPHIGSHILAEVVNV